MVRVSGLQEAVEGGFGERSPDGLTPADQLKAIRAKLKPLLDLHMRCLKDDIIPALSSNDVVIKVYGDLSKREKKHATDLFSVTSFQSLRLRQLTPVTHCPTYQTLV